MKKIIFESENFMAFCKEKPHIPREDGGHIIIKPKKDGVESRLDLSPKEATEVMYVSMLVSDAMILGLKKQGINIKRINYQDNGNWAFLKNKKPHFHIHLYGRTEESKTQPFGSALYFPNPSDPFYNNFEPLNDEDIKSIKKEINKLKKLDKYKIESWLKK